MHLLLALTETYVSRKEKKDLLQRAQVEIRER